MMLLTTFIVFFSFLKKIMNELCSDLKNYFYLAICNCMVLFVLYENMFPYTYGAKLSLIILESKWIYEICCNNLTA